MAEQMNFKRAEIKYITNTDQMFRILDKCRGRLTADPHGKSTIYSLYMDTPDYLLARRSLDKPLYKEKLRLRSYGKANASSRVFIELKKKFESIVYKRRVEMDMESLDRYLKCKDALHRGKAEGEERNMFNQKLINDVCADNSFSISSCQMMRELDFAIERYEGMEPRVLLNYDRESYYAKDDHEFRVTFDTNVRFRTEELSLESEAYGEPLTGREQVLMEVKAGGAVPLWFTSILTGEKLFPKSFSKYGNAYLRLAKRHVLPQQAAEVENNGGEYHDILITEYI